MKLKTIANLFYALAGMIYLVGLGLIWWKLGWVVTLGIMLVVWAINLEQRVKRLNEVVQS